MLEVIDIATWLGHVKLFNGYGPTEASVCCGMRLVESGDAPATIGESVGAIFWVVELDNHNRLTLVGCIGELVLQGPGLARGYLNDPEKTAEAFITETDWLSQNAIAKMHKLYKTGDLVRYSSTGELEYIGRKDNQIKLRGQRIELGEVENQISRNIHVQSSITVVPRSGPCKDQLVAIIAVSKPDKSSTTSDQLQLVSGLDKERSAMLITTLREELLNRLPLYMVPHEWVVVYSIPLSASGKADRRIAVRWIETMTEDMYRALRETATETYVAPATATEEYLKQ